MVFANRAEAFGGPVRVASLLTIVAAFGVAQASAAGYNSYTQAYRDAGESQKPMLVVLNGPAGGDQVHVDDLAGDREFASAVDNYVVAELDTTTDHGKKVYELFDSPMLPTVVVIDDAQKKQLFRTSRSMTADELATVLNEYKDGPPAASKTATKSVLSGTTVSKPMVSSPAPYAVAPTTPAPSYTAPPVSMPSFSPGLSPAVPANCPSCRLKAMGL